MKTKLKKLSALILKQKTAAICLVLLIAVSGITVSALKNKTPKQEPDAALTKDVALNDQTSDSTFTDKNIQEEALQDTETIPEETSVPEISVPESSVKEEALKKEEPAVNKPAISQSDTYSTNQKNKPADPVPQEEPQSPAPVPNPPKEEVNSPVPQAPETKAADSVETNKNQGKSIRIQLQQGNGKTEIVIPDRESPAPETPAPVPETPAPAPKPALETPKAPDTGSQSSYNEDYANQVLSLLNTERANAGLPALTMNSGASAAAKIRAKEIVSSFSHTRPSGQSPFTALDESSVSYKAAGENIAYGQRTPEAVMNGWMNSSGHRANILHQSFTQVGIACYSNNGTLYWVQLFIG